ncbi:MAG: hypothetical protein MUP90_05320 [Gammaproteobacteria bacterium]|nr:hypothetical protein [Gammaproteobacteria bacterium]
MAVGKAFVYRAQAGIAPAKPLHEPIARAVELPSTGGWKTRKPGRLVMMIEYR